MCSTFISLNGNALTGPRAYFAMARDGLLPRRLCRIHPRFQTPANAMLAQGVWAIVLTIAGTALIVVPPPDGWPASPAVLGSDPRPPGSKLNKTPLYDLLLHLRDLRRQPLLHAGDRQRVRAAHQLPDLPRPYRTWGYPFTPLLYVAAAVLLLGNMLVDPQSRVQSLVGLGLILLGIPAWAILRQRTGGRREARPQERHVVSIAGPSRSRGGRGPAGARQGVRCRARRRRPGLGKSDVVHRRLARTSRDRFPASGPTRCISSYRLTRSRPATWTIPLASISARRIKSRAAVA